MVCVKCRGFYTSTCSLRIMQCIQLLGNEKRCHWNRMPEAYGPARSVTYSWFQLSILQPHPVAWTWQAHRIQDSPMRKSAFLFLLNVLSVSFQWSNLMRTVWQWVKYASKVWKEGRGHLWAWVILQAYKKIVESWYLISFMLITSELCLLITYGHFLFF